MIVVMKPLADESCIGRVVSIIKENGLHVHLSEGKEVTIVGVVGDKTRLDHEKLQSLPGVEKIVHVTESYKLSNIKFHPEPTVIRLPHTSIGPENLTIMAGPGAVESEEQLMMAARAVKKAGATMLRGGAFKPQTSPYAFQGLGEEGLKLMKQASEETGLDTICEVTSCRTLEIAAKYLDMIQVGARNMQNYELLKEIGQTKIPVMLKRGLSSTIEEWLNAAEYIMANGNEQVALCERGIRTFETATANTLDLSAVCVLKEKTHLPVIVDPCHATGVRRYVQPLSKAAVSCGADGLIIEVHPDPEGALCEGAQSLSIPEFTQFMKDIKTFTILAGRVF